MSSSELLSGETLQFQKQNSVRLSNHHDNNTLKEKPIIGTFQENPSCSSYSRNSLEANAGNVYEEAIGEGNFGGSFRRAKTDGNFFGGNFRTLAFDDTQVVPDFNDLLETIHVDIDRTSDSSGPRRRNSERDELEIYFPCVLTPLPVDRLYSTLVDDSTVFKFPVASVEFLADDKSKQGWSSEDGGPSNYISQDNRHSLDSFANLSIFSCPGGSEPKFNDTLDLTSETWKQQNFSDTWISLTGKKSPFDNTEEQNRFSNSAPQQRVLPLSTMIIGNKLKFEKCLGLASGSCPEAINIVTDQNSNSAKVVTPRQSSQTAYDLPVQFMPTSQQRLEFPESLTVNNDLSLNPFSLDDQRNLFDGPVGKPAFMKQEHGEDGETSFEHTRLEYREVPPLVSNLGICNAQENLCKKKSRRAKELPCFANNGMVKTKATANHEGSDVEYSEISHTRSKSRKSKPEGNERGQFYHGNSRGFHNDMEKQRRVNMKTRFENLRMALPELSDNGKASKIAILRKALECIGMLEKESTELENVKRTERLKNIELLNKLQKITSGKC